MAQWRRSELNDERDEVVIVCSHIPRCPAPTARERLAALVASPHPEQGWSLLCNGVVVFDDGGALLPDGVSIAPPIRAA